MVTGRGFKNQGRPIPQWYLAPGGSDDRETSDSGRHPIPWRYRREVGEASNEKAAISGSLKLGGRAKLGWEPRELRGQTFGANSQASLGKTEPGCLATKLNHGGGGRNGRTGFWRKQPSFSGKDGAWWLGEKLREGEIVLGHPCVLLGDSSILIPPGLLSHTPDSVGIAYMHEAGSPSHRRHSSIRSPPITTPGSVEHSTGTPPSPAKSPSRSLKTKELIPPPDGGPEPLTDTPTPYGCGKDRWSLDTGRKRSLSRHQKASSPCGCGFVIP
jgi:hypothetical protein